MSDLTGKIAVVTGAASGIGLAVAESLVARGSRVLLVDINPNVEEQAVRLCQRSYVGDLTDSAIRHAMIRAAEDAYGAPPSIGVFAAGITRDGFAVRPPKEGGTARLFDEKDWDKVQNVNLKAPFYCACELVGRLMETGHIGAHEDGDAWIGQVVFLGSISSEGNAGQANYAATKAAQRALVTTLNLEWNKRLGVRAAIVHPGFTATSMTAAMRPDILEAMLKLTQSGKLHTAESVANAVHHAIVNESVQEIFLDHFLHVIPPATPEKVDEDYYDDGVYLGEPDDPEGQADALHYLETMGPMPELFQI